MVLSLLVPHIKTSRGLLKSFLFDFPLDWFAVGSSIECLAVTDGVSCVSSSSQQDSFFLFPFFHPFTESEKVS